MSEPRTTLEEVRAQLQQIGPAVHGAADAVRRDGDALEASGDPTFVQHSLDVLGARLDGLGTYLWYVESFTLHDERLDKVWPPSYDLLHIVPALLMAVEYAKADPRGDVLQGEQAAPRYLRCSYVAQDVARRIAAWLDDPQAP